jgi:hypothetical protein
MRIPYIMHAKSEQSLEKQQQRQQQHTSLNSIALNHINSVTHYWGVQQAIAELIVPLHAATATV